MCGLAGFVDFSSISSKTELLAMRQTLRHRGPDDEGIEFFNTSWATVGLAHNRLSIIDLSPLGHQPMFYKQFVIVFNGEIYNYLEVKKELEGLGHPFASHSDTEVILHAFEEWGARCVEKFIGMFAFVIYNTEKECLYACRDRVGVKPFFYYWDGDLLLFGSELKSFHPHVRFKKTRQINMKSLGLFLQYGYVPGPQSIFENVWKLDPGSWLTLNCRSKQLSIEKYWKAEDYYKKKANNLSYEDASAKLEELLLSACQYRMVSDVPVGIFLSGGFDSTLVTALLQSTSARQLKTFTIGFPDGINEAPFASEIARHLGTDHNSYDCTEEDAKRIIPELPYFYDEPCADISTIPTILVSRLAKKKVTVALSADGGDELFAGYNGFQEYQRRLKLLRSVPLPKFASKVLGLATPFVAEDNHHVRRKFEGTRELLSRNRGEQPSQLLEQTLGLPKSYVNRILSEEIQFAHPYSKIESSEFFDERNYFLHSSIAGALTDQLLVKMDRATMSCSLEGREPLLDHRLIEFAGRLSYDFKHDGSQAKKILRDIVYKYVPKQLMDRPKTGFDLPIFKWLRNDLSYLFDDFFSDQSLKRHNLFNAEEIKAMKNKFNNGVLHYESAVWRIISFQMWHNKWMN